MKRVKLAVLLMLAAPSIASAQATGTITGVSPVFGVITAAEEGRIVQLGLRYSF